jgi:hypothetical protein
MQLPLGGIERIAVVSQEWAHHQTLRQLTAALPATQSRFPLLSLNIIFLSVRLLVSHFYPGRLFNIIIFIYKYFSQNTHRRIQNYISSSNSIARLSLYY